MNTLRLKNYIACIFISLLTPGLLASCSKEEDGESPSPYPKNVSITYKVTKLAGDMTSVDVTYSNETGGYNVDEEAAFPFTKVVERKVDRYERAGLSVSTDSGGTVKLEILVNDEVVESKEFTDDGYYVLGSVTHTFK